MTGTGSDMFRLDGRVALVTGGSGGIGKALGIGLGLAGARLALTGRSQERLDDNAAAAEAAGCEDVETFGQLRPDRARPAPRRWRRLLPSGWGESTSSSTWPA